MKRVITILGLFCVAAMFFQCDNEQVIKEDKTHLEQLPDSLSEHYRVNLSPSYMEDFIEINTQDYRQGPESQFVNYYQPKSPVVIQDENEDVGWFQWAKENWLAILGILSTFLVLGESVAKLTRTEKDNAWFKWLRNLIDGILPNRKSGGGIHPS